jgi:hypothetical protein
MSGNQSDLTAFDGETPEGACVRYEICGRQCRSAERTDVRRLS